MVAPGSKTRERHRETETQETERQGDRDTRSFFFARLCAWSVLSLLVGLLPREIANSRLLNQTRAMTSSSEPSGAPKVQRILRVHHDVQNRHDVLVGAEMPEQLELPQYSLGVPQVSENVLDFFHGHSLPGGLRHVVWCRVVSCRGRRRRE